MKSSKKIKLGQIERGDELAEIDKKAIDNEVVHKEGDETIRDTKTFKKAPKSEKDATAGDQLVRKSQMDTELSDKSENDEVVHLTGDEEIDGVKDFLKSPTSQEAAASDHELVRKKEFDDGLDGKVSKQEGKQLSDNNYTNAEKQKLAQMESSKFRGTFGSLAEIKQEYPEGENEAWHEGKGGWYADVDKQGEDPERYIWDFNDFKWVQGSIPELTGEQIKQMYEEQPDTNPFTDDEKTKLGNLDPEQIDEDHTTLANMDPNAQENTQSDYFELDQELDSYIKNKEGCITVTDEFMYEEGEDQKFDLGHDYVRVIDVDVNGQSLKKAQYNQWHKAIEIMPSEELEVKNGVPDEISVTTFVRTNWKRIHGFRFKVDTPAPEVERIGADMSEELPIQKRMRGCTLLDNGKRNYWLADDDWAKKDDDSASDLTGADGQVMVRLPRHWVKDYIDGDYRVLLFSDEPFEANREVPEMYIGAYKAALNRDGNILSSVVNHTTDYRGGNNQSAWDSEIDIKSQIGKPVSNIDRINAWEYAKNRGINWYPILYQAHEALAWLITYETGTRNHQTAISEGPTDINSTNWVNFNDRYPLFKCGLTDVFGNGTGEIPVDLTGLDLGTEETQVFRYRGLENWWGDIYEWISGVNVLDNKFYKTTGKLQSDNNVDGYKLIGPRPTSNGYIEEMWPGTVLPRANSGSSGTYYADYLYTNDTETIRGLLRSAGAYNTARAGSFFLDSNNAPSTSATYRGSRLCFVRR